MKIIFKSMILFLAFVCQDFRAQAQETSDCDLTDPLFDFQPEIDLCCGASTQQCYELGYLDDLWGDIAEVGPFFFLEIDYEGQSFWDGHEKFGTYEQLAAQMTAVFQSQGINITFTWDEVAKNICTSSTLDIGDLVLCHGCGAIAENEWGIQVIPPQTIGSDCNITEPDISDILDPENADIDESVVIFDGAAGSLTTGDILNGPNTLPVDYTGPSMESAAILLNAAVTSGALQNGAGCFNLNCLDLESFTAQAGADFAAIAASTNTINLPSDFDQSAFEAALMEEIQVQIFQNGGGITNWINTQLGFNIPDQGPCTDGMVGLEDQIQGLMSGNSGKNGKEGGFPSKFMPQTGNGGTSADQNYFSSAIPGLGLGRPGSANPSPSSLAMIENVNAGVDLYNGSQSTSVPLYTVQANDISIPISLSSSNNGLKVNDMGSIVGQNWSLNAGGMISRVMKGLPDEFDGIIESVGVGKKYKLGPRFEMPKNFGIAIEPATPPCGDPTCPIGPIESKIIRGYQLYPAENCKPDVLTIRWSPLEFNMINFTFKIPIFQIFGLQVFVELGFSMGVAPNETLGHITYKEEGKGFLNVGVPSVGGAADQLDLLQSVHPNREYDEAAFFSDAIAKFDPWIQLISGDKLYETEKMDSEPDEFYFNFGGYSGKFMFGADGLPVMFPNYPGVNISDPVIEDGHIVQFTITTPEGMEYIFGQTDMTGVDMTTNTQYYLPNFYTYPEIGTDRVAFGGAEIDVARETILPFIGGRARKSYGNTYERNYKVTKMPKFSSAWHLMSIRSLLTQELVEFTYDTSEVVYYADKSFSHTFPNFAVGDGQFLTFPNTELNDFRILPSKWENGRAEFAYNATKTELERWDITAILPEAQREESVEFLYNAVRNELVTPEATPDDALSDILVHRGCNIYKGWHLSYDSPNVSESTSQCTPGTMEEPEAPPISIDGELTFDLGNPYTLNPFEYNHSLYINLRISCFVVPFHVPLPYLIGQFFDFGYKTHLSEYGSLMEVKALTPNDSYDATLETAIFNAEKQRTFLDKITEYDRDANVVGTEAEFVVADFTYHNNGEGLPKRFSVNQDLFGYFSDNSDSGSPFPPINYTSIIGNQNITPNNFADGGATHYGFFNVDAPDGMLQGQREETDPGNVRIGALENIQFASGGSISYTYGLNELPNGNLGAGIRVSSMTESPGGSPPKTTNYDYETPTVVNDPIRMYQNDANYYYRNFEEKVIATSGVQNELFSNKSNHVGYGIVYEFWDEIGRVEHYFTTPDNFSEHIAETNGIGTNGVESRFVEIKRCHDCPDINLPGELDPYEFSSADASNMPPSLRFVEGSAYKTWLLGLEHENRVLNAAESLVQATTTDFEVYADEGGTNLFYFKSEMYQNNYPGSFNKNYIYRLIQQFKPFALYGGGILDDYITLIKDLIIGQSKPHPFKEIERNYFVSDRRLFTGNIRPTSSITTKTYLDDASKSVETTYNYGTLPSVVNTDEDSFGYPKSVLTTSEDGTSTETINYFSYEIADQSLDDLSPEILGPFGLSANYLNSINYQAPIASRQNVEGVTVGANVTGLGMAGGNEERVIPLTNWKAVGGRIVLAGIFEGHNADGKPSTYRLAKFNVGANSTNPDDFFPDITLEWNSRLQLDSRTYEASVPFTTTYVYNCYHELETLTDQDGIVTNYMYDNRGRLEIAKALNERQTTTYVYNIGDGGNWIQTTLEFDDGEHPNQVTKQIVDGFGKPLATIRENDGAPLSGTVYDNFWRVITSSTLSSGETNIAHEASPISRRTITTDAVGNVTKSEMFGETGFFEKTVVTDPNGNLTPDIPDDYESETHTDGLGRTRKMVSPEGGTTEYTYTALGQPLRIENPAEEIYTFTYNVIDQLAERKIPGAGTQTVYWDVAYRPAASEDSNGNVQIFEHDEYNRVTNIYKAAVSSVNQPTEEAFPEGTFDGLISNIVLKSNTYVSGHTWLGSTTDIIMSGGAANGFNGEKGTTYSGHNDIGQPEEIVETYPLGAAITTPNLNDAGLSKSTVKNIGGEIFNYTFSYDDILRPVDTELATGSISKVISSLEYNGMDLVSKKFLGQIEENEYLQQIDYTYDAAGKLLQINDKFDMECFVDETVCEMTLTLEYPLKGKPSCNLLTNIIVDGLSYPIPANFDVLDPANDLASIIEEAIDYHGFEGIVTETEVETEDTHIIDLTISNTNAASVSLVFEDCEISYTFDTANCCEEDDTNNPSPVPGANFTENDDLFFEDITYTGLDITRIDIASDCSTGWMRNDYSYDQNHRVLRQLNAVFNPTRIDGRYNANFGYDAAGNITNISRNGWFKDGEDNEHYGLIDNLIYDYSFDDDGNYQLNKVTDAIDITVGNNEFAQPEGFVPNIDNPSIYHYDNNGNMTQDEGKGLFIEYNLINLPSKVVGADGDMILDYTFSAEKVRKDGEEERFYAAGLERVDGENESYYFGDGRIVWKEGEAHIQYCIKDHLGNTAVFFEDKNEDGDIITELMSQEPEEREVIQRNHYYPFGMPMKGGWNAVTTPAQDYLYNGKENEEELGLNWQAYGFRYYDNAIGRFTGVDPMAEKYAAWTPYHYVLNTPINAIDPDGRLTVFVGGAVWQPRRLQRIRRRIARNPNQRQSSFTKEFVRQHHNLLGNSFQFLSSSKNGGWIRSGKLHIVRYGSVRVNDRRVRKMAAQIQAMSEARPGENVNLVGSSTGSALVAQAALAAADNGVDINTVTLSATAVSKDSPLFNDLIEKFGAENVIFKPNPNDPVSGAAGQNPQEGLANFRDLLFNPSKLGEHNEAGKDASRVDDLINETIIQRETEGAETAERARNQQN